MQLSATNPKIIQKICQLHIPHTFLGYRLKTAQLEYSDSILFHHSQELIPCHSVPTTASVSNMVRSRRQNQNGTSAYLRKFPVGTDAYKNIYKQCTVTERINNRILNDYTLQRIRVHRREHYSFLTTIIGICIHLDARYKQKQVSQD